MRDFLADLVAMVGIGLRGLRSRRMLTLGSVLLTAIAVAAAVVGPMYQAGAAASYLVTKLRSQPPYVTGASVDYTPGRPSSGSRAIKDALDAVDSQALAHFREPELSLVSQRIAPTAARFFVSSPEAFVRLLAQAGICSRLVVTGRCPSRPGEMLLLASDAAYTDTRVGDRIGMSHLSRPLTVVGTYRPPTKGHLEFDPSRFVSVPPQRTSTGLTPYYPAPFVVPAGTLTKLEPQKAPGGGISTTEPWFVRMDYRLRVPASATVTDVRQATAELSRLRRSLGSMPGGATSSIELGNQLKPVITQTLARKVTAQQTVAPAVISLILVALVLLVRLLSTAMELRRPELALAGLRGIDRPALWVLAMLEPALTLIIAAPLGLAAGYFAERWLAATWLVPGLPARFGWSSVSFALTVLLSCLAVAALAVRSSLSDPLSAQIAGVRRPTRSRRWAVLVRLAVVAGAAVLLGATLWSGGQSRPKATDLLLPILLAVAAGLLTTLTAVFVSKWWANRSARRRGVAGYVASRTIARRREGAWVILPLTAALAISVFAAGTYSAAAAWRGSYAATMVGADSAYQVKIPLAQAVALTHELDPKGRWLMAVGADADLNGRKVIVDAPRLSRVAAWPDSWTSGVDVAVVQREIAPPRPSLVMHGRRISMTVTNKTNGGSGRVLVSVDVLTPATRSTHIYLGPFPPGRATDSAAMPYCADGCLVTGMTISGPGTLARAMRGAVTITGVRVAGASSPYFTRIGWRGTSNATYIYGKPSVTNTQVSGSTLSVEVDTHGKPAVALLAPRDGPAVVPVLMGRTARPHVLAQDGNELTVASSLGPQLHIRAVATGESMPFFGPYAMLVDYTIFTRTNPVFEAETNVYILARADTPPAILSQLAAHGITQPTTLQQVGHTLDQDAYALALNLYVVVAALVILLALAGLAVNMAVQIPARRRDAASLRVVGVPRRSLVTAVALEFTAALGSAAIAGILAGALAQYVVVRTITLGYADDFRAPRVLPSLDVPTLAVLLAVAVAVLLCVAVFLGSLTVRGARTATLRENVA